MREIQKENGDWDGESVNNDSKNSGFVYLEMGQVDPGWIDLLFFFLNFLSCVDFCDWEFRDPRWTNMILIYLYLR